MNHSETDRAFRTCRNQGHSGLPSWLAGSCLLACLLLAGCGRSEDGPPRVPVSGTVTLAEQPVSNAMVTFLPTETGKGQPAQGATDEAGRFMAGSGSQDGLVPGNYQIRIEAWKVPQHQMEPSASQEEQEANRAIPAKYFDAGTSGLTLRVQESDGPHELDLKLNDEPAQGE